MRSRQMPGLRPKDPASDLPAGVWSQSNTIALARQKCVDCLGLGITFPCAQREKPCKCVLRQIFRACHRKFRDCVTCEPSLSGPGFTTLGVKNPGSTRSSAACGAATRRRYGYPKAEFVADFLAIAKRTLGTGSIGYGVFRLHFERGHEWRVCCRRLGIDRGSFFHEVYRVEEKLGRAFREVAPFALFPIDEYFRGTTGPRPA